MEERQVTITGSGRAGTVTYREAAGVLSFYWELGGGDVAAIVQTGSAAAWKERHPWAAGHRAEIQRFVAQEVVRQMAAGGRADVDERAGDILVRQGAATAAPAPAAGPAWYFRLRRLQVQLALLTGAGALAVGGGAWVTNRIFTIQSGAGIPTGLSVRTETHVATLIRTLEPYTPSLHRDPSRDRFRIGLFLVPLDGSRTRLLPLREGLAANEYALAKILGSDGRTLWFDVAGVGGVDLSSYEVRPAETLGDAPPPGTLQGARTLPFAPRVEVCLGAGYLTAPRSWLGLHSPAEAALDLKPGMWLRPVVHADSTKQVRSFYRGTLGEASGYGSRRIVAMEAIGGEGYANGAFLRLDDRSEPLRLADPDGALIAYASEPGLHGTLMVARATAAGALVWKTDTGIARLALVQILPGEQAMVFVGTRPAVPNKVSEPLLVIVENATGKSATHSLWQ